MSNDTPCNLFLQACKNAGVKVPNQKLIRFFQKRSSFDSIEEIDLQGNYIGNRGVMALL